MGAWMILDILTVLFFVLGFVLILWMIGERRRDVLYGPYVPTRVPVHKPGRRRAFGDGEVWQRRRSRDRRASAVASAAFSDSCAYRARATVPFGAQHFTRRSTCRECYIAPRRLVEKDRRADVRFGSRFCKKCRRGRSVKPDRAATRLTQ